jgi:hypothetical protein
MKVDSVQQVSWHPGLPNFPTVSTLDFIDSISACVKCSLESWLYEVEHFLGVGPGGHHDSALVCCDNGARIDRHFRCGSPESGAL